MRDLGIFEYDKTWKCILSGRPSLHEPSNLFAEACGHADAICASRYTWYDLGVGEHHMFMWAVLVTIEASLVS